MKSKLISTMRVAVLFTIFGLGFIGIVAVDNIFFPTKIEWIILSKIFGILIFWCGVTLYKRWSKTDKWIKAYEERCRKTDEAPNPMRQ